MRPAASRAERPTPCRDRRLGSDPAAGLVGPLVLLLSFLSPLLPHAAAQVAVQGDVVHTMAGEAIREGVVLVGEDGTIEAVGPADEVEVPSGYERIRGAVVTPGLVDARSVVGLSGHLNVPDDQDQLDSGGAIQPELRAYDAYNARELLVEWVRSHGVTTIHTGHGPGALISGQTMVVKPRGTTVEAGMVDSLTMIAMQLGPEVSATFSPDPGTRSRGIAMLREELVRAQEYRERTADADGGPPRDLGLEVLAHLLDGEVRALVTAHRVSEILAALRLQREFGFPMVLDGAAEAYLVAEEIRSAGVPVILHPTMARHEGSLENATFETARRLLDAGVEVALQSGFEPYVPKTRVLLFEAAPLVAYGLSFEEALATVTIQSARVLGQDHRVGSLEVGKDGDLAVFDGDPFEYTTRVCSVVIEGEIVSDVCH